MYGSDRFAVPLSRPYPVYIPRPSTIAGSNKPFPLRNDLDDFVYHPELPQGSSTENSGENRPELMVSSDIRDLSSCFSNYAATLTAATAGPAIPRPPFMSSAMPIKENMVLSDVRQYVPTESIVDCEGTSRDEERKPEREHRKRSKNWTRPETLKLIRARSDIDPKFGRSGKKAELWDQISEVLQKDGFSRDAQQCKDKWEKLCAAYKDVKEGTRDKEDFPYHNELHQILSGRSKKRDREPDATLDPIKERHEAGQIDDLDLDLSGDFGFRDEESPHFNAAMSGTVTEMGPESALDDFTQKRKKVEYVSLADMPAVQELMASLLAKQQKFFTELLETMEKREEQKEKLRQEREDKWRAEDLEERRAFNNTMMILMQKLLGDGSTQAVNSSDNAFDEQGCPKRRSKNWKRSEILQLIRLRIEMNSMFVTSTKRASLWEELAETLGAQGIQRDGKQCREKWEKLMSEFKDVIEGKRDQSESPFFLELKAFVEQGNCNP